MSITDKLVYLNETKRQLREAINAVFGAELTESDSFRSYVDVLHDIWTPELLFQDAEQGDMSITDKLVYLNETKRQLREAINAVFGAELTESDSFRSYVDSLWEIYILSNLFNAGQQGGWYDPSDLSTLFQDAEGTTPVTADGDPVGLMLDKSGNGNHASQGVSASRPVYRTDGTLHWLELNGISTNMPVPVNVLNGSSELYAASAARFDNLSTTNCLFRFSLAGEVGRARFHLEAGRSAGHYNVVARRRGSDPLRPLNTDSIYTTGQDVVLVGRVDFSTATALIRVNGVEDGRDENYLGEGSVADLDSADARLFTSASGRTQHMLGRAYGIIISTQPVKNNGEVEKYLAAKAGVTL